MKNQIQLDKALNTTVLHLKKYTDILKISHRPFIFNTCETTHSTRLFVTPEGHLKTIQKGKLN